MLPGFRFLLVATVLSMSILVFGLGAAALLRAAHEEFVSTPLWRTTPQTVFAQPSEATRPVLSMLSVAPPVDAASPSDQNPAAAAPAEPAMTVAAPASPEPTATLKPEATPLPEPGKLELPPAEMPAQSEAAPAPGDAPAGADATKVTTTVPPAGQAAPANAEPVSLPAATQSAASPAAVERASVQVPAEQASAPAPVEPASTPAPAEPASAPAPVEQASAPAVPETTAASTKIATAGGPAATGAEQSPAKREIIRVHRSARKREPARRVVRHRMIAQPAHIAPPAPQPPATSFTFTPMTSPPRGG